MRLNWFFKDSINDNSCTGSDNTTSDNYECNLYFFIKSDWNPPRADPPLESYLSLIEEESISIANEGKNFNLFATERQALYDLKSDKSIVIKEEDKRLVVVVWDREDYCGEA